VGEKLLLSRGSLSRNPFHKPIHAGCPFQFVKKTHDRPLEKAFRAQSGCFLVLCLLDLATLVIDHLLTGPNNIVIHAHRNDVGGRDAEKKLLLVVARVRFLMKSALLR
jgi:hypothetical protein